MNGEMSGYPPIRVEYRSVMVVLEKRIIREMTNDCDSPLLSDALCSWCVEAQKDISHVMLTRGCDSELE